MSKSVKKELEELYDFIMSLDFKRIDENTIELIPNRFNLDELPETIKEYVNSYLDALDIIN